MAVMDHVAIMKRSWGLIPKVLDGRKKIESRWGKNKRAPWGKIKIGDVIYFKNSGEPIIVKAVVSKIQEFENLNYHKVKDILKKFGGDDGISVADLKATIEWAKDKKYCTFIHLKNPGKVKPFNINKKGFGSAAAWISTKNIKNITLPLR